jgi:hypothetical protein
MEKPMSIETYNEGYAIGKAWKQNWIPGGPWVMRPHLGRKDNPVFMEKCRQSQQDHDDWVKGWEAGKSQATT